MCPYSKQFHVESCYSGFLNHSERLCSNVLAFLTAVLEISIQSDLHKGYSPNVTLNIKRILPKIAIGFFIILGGIEFNEFA